MFERDPLASAAQFARAYESIAAVRLYMADRTLLLRPTLPKASFERRACDQLFPSTPAVRFEPVLLIDVRDAKRAALAHTSERRVARVDHC